jgi:hypothetical protein
VTVRAQEPKPVIGPAGNGKMKLYELFSPIGAPKENDDINWHGDFKFFIDNDNSVLSNVMFPAIKKHMNYRGHPSAYKIYIKPLQQCKEMYCNKYKIETPEEKFTKEDIIGMARKIAAEQEKYIERGDYED